MKMLDIKPQSEWFLNEPKALVNYIYWCKGQICNSVEKGILEIATQLNAKYPCPEEYKSKWGL